MILQTKLKIKYSVTKIDKYELTLITYSMTKSNARRKETKRVQQQKVLLMEQQQASHQFKKELYNEDTMVWPEMW